MPKATDKAVSQYLARHAEPEAAVVAGMDLDEYPFCLVIPAREEDWPQIASALAGITEPFLLILVVNSPEPDAQTLRLLDITRRQGRRIANIRNVDYLKTPFPFDILLVDRCTQRQSIPPREGVGLARKLGADMALALMARRTVMPGFIYCTDADVELPADYFQTRQWPSEVAALLFPFAHVAEPSLREAASLYEISMLYYAAGLDYAGSPYAFPTLGSCLAVDMHHYARVRGFPRRNAAEDFYLLNKLAKTGQIRMLPAPLIRVAGRYSARVPFGTGIGIAKIAQLHEPAVDFVFYHPRIFDLLRQWLVWLDGTWSNAGVPSAAKDVPELAAWIESNGIDALVARTLSRCRTKAVFTKALHDWFDGGRTLKFVHFMRDNFLPSVPLAGLVEAAFLQLPPTRTPDITSLHNQLMVRVFQHHHETR